MNNLRINLPAIVPFLLLTGLFISSTSSAATKRHVIENQFIKMVIIPRTAQQMAAFYEGREFPNRAIKATSSACFFTVGIHNKTKDLIWLDTEQWQLDSQGRGISLLSKQQWKQRWQKINLAQRFQSTFRWTLLPEKLDFQPGEHEGGNITILRQEKPFNLIANFATEANKQGKALRLEFKNITCAKDK